jgi:hypothetical protein
MAKSWQWLPRNRNKFWEKVRTIAKDYALPTVRLAQVPGAFVPVPGLSRGLEKVESLFGSDLNISELDSAQVLQALDGTPGPYESSDGSSPVFVDGVMASITVSHTRTGKEIISLERIELLLLEYTAGRNPAYEERPRGDEIFGAGFIEPLRFFVEIGKAGVGRARRALKDAKGKTTMLVAAGANFLDTDPAGFLALGPDDPPAMFRFAITAKDPGLYRVCLAWFYRVSGKELRQHTSLPILIYKTE